MRALIILTFTCIALRVDARPAPVPILPLANCYFEPQVFPKDGAKNVPLDAKAWLIGGDLVRFDFEFRLRSPAGEQTVRVTKHPPFEIAELDLGALRPRTRYSVLPIGGEPIMTFTTGTTSSSDRVPATPRITVAHAVHDLPQTSFFEMELVPDPDRVVAQVEIRGRNVQQGQPLVVPIDTAVKLGTSCANVGIGSVGERIQFSVRTVDLAGRRSEEATSETTTEQGPGMPDYHDNRYDREGFQDRPKRKPRWWRHPTVLVITGLLIGAGLLTARARRRRRSPLA